MKVLIKETGRLNSERYQSLSNSSTFSSEDLTRPTENNDMESMKKRKQTFLPGALTEHDHDEKIFKWSKSGSLMEPVSTTIYNNNAVTHFITGSKYVGQWNALGICGKGIYKFPHGAIYDGFFNRNGEFHGSGMLIYPNGQRLEGFWRNGKFVSGAISNKHFVYHKDYCKIPDRRFQIEIESELQPANHENLTNQSNPRIIPNGCYDTGEGFYDPKLRVIRKYKDKDEAKSVDKYDDWLDDNRRTSYGGLLETTPKESVLLNQMKTWSPNDIDSLIDCTPDKTKETWIKRFCRKAWDEPIGYKAGIYENWTTGSRKYETDFDNYQDITSRRENSSINTYSMIIDPDAVSSFINVVKPSGDDFPKGIMFTKIVKTEEITNLLLKKLYQQTAHKRLKISPKRRKSSKRYKMSH